ncbi:MAG: hypothetical protein ACQR33_05405 [Candidatus Saccharibacteria bacterium]
MNWQYAAGAVPVPFAAINTILGAFYNKDTESPTPVRGEYPYFYPVHDELKRFVGLLIGDIQDVDANGNTTGVELTDSDKWNLFTSSLKDEARLPQPKPWKPGDWREPSFWDPVLGLAGVKWQIPDGLLFPDAAINELLGFFYEENVQPFLYPVFSPAQAGPVHQIGILMSGLRNEASTAQEIAASALRDFKSLGDNPFDTREYHL